MFDRGDRIGEAEDMNPDKPISLPTIPIYTCRDCGEIFKLINEAVCPECNSNNVKHSGPYAKLKQEGEPASRDPGEIFYHCWNCDHDWTEK